MNKFMLRVALLACILVMVAESSSSRAPARDSCDGTIRTCSSGDHNMTRRSLAQNGQRYISYEALKKNAVACGQRGASYYGCYGQSRQANPYNRGCSAITHCLRYTS